MLNAGQIAQKDIPWLDLLGYIPHTLAKAGDF
jgi:hypothetical protein